MAHSLPHDLKNLCHSQITTAHRHLSIYVHIVFMKFFCGRQRFVSFFPHLPGEGCYCRFYQSCSPPPPPPHPPPPPRSPDPSGHSRTSTASSRSQWALPDLNRELQIAMPDLNRELQVAVGTAGPQPRAPDPSGHCRTSTASSRSQWALPDLNGQIECQKICQKICQIECQKICQIECQKICQKIC